MKILEVIKELEINIENTKWEYAILISEVENIKKEKATVEDKCIWSQLLIKNLSSERVRWDDSRKNFENQMATILGDCMLAGSFLTYSGFFDHFYRKYLY